MENSPEMTKADNFGPRLNRSCDACQARKIRCTVSGSEKACAACQKRDVTCHFSLKKPAHRRNVAKQFLAPAPKRTRSATAALTLEPSKPSARPSAPPTPDPVDSSSSSSPRVQDPCVPDIYVDRLLAQASQDGASVPEDATFVPRNGIFGARNSLTFFSDRRLQSLERCLGNQKVNRLVDRIETVINGRLRRIDSMAEARRSKPSPAVLTESQAAHYAELYFEHVHPLYPFLDIDTWNATVSRPDFHRDLDRNKPWHCLYHAVLALGCQHAQGGSFEPGKGTSWAVFSLALAAFSDLLLLPDSLIVLQALTAMALYGLGVSAMAVEHVIVSEASRRAQSMSKMQFSGSSAHAYRRTFWLLYSMEKVTSFHFGRSSSFVDGDISCPIPTVPEATSAGFNWFLPLIRFARLLSRAYTSLYSVGVSSNPSSYYLGVVKQLRFELESWRNSLPDTGFRPGGFVRPHAMLQRQSRSLALMFHYFYHSLLLTLCRTTLWAAPGVGDAEALARAERRKQQALHSARSVLELTAIIDVEPYTQICILAGIPLTALFVLFDMVVQDSGLRSQETQSNLALLDMAAGHFSRIEYASGGTLPGSLIAEFAHVARDYVNGRPGEAAPASSAPDLGATRTTAMPTSLTTDQQVPLAGVESVAGWVFEPMPADLGSLDTEVQLNGEYGVGTNVMDLFNYFVPDLDPMFYDGAGPWRESGTWG